MAGLSLRDVDPSRATEQLLFLGVPYPITKKIGEGTFSTVWQCTDPSTHLPVALKRTTVSGDPATLLKLHADLEFQERLQHPNIVRTIGSEVVRVNGDYAASVMMECCDVSLVDVMKGRTSGGGGGASKLYFSENEIVAVAASVGAALFYLHAREVPVAHRDVKPENVLLFRPNQDFGARSRGGLSRSGGGADGVDCPLVVTVAAGAAVYKLCDFGSVTTESYRAENAQDVNRIRSDVDRNTTLLYRAPEMVDPWKKQRIDESVDVWALGVLLYYVMYYTFPFEETNLSILKAKVVFPTTTGAQRVANYSDMLKHVVLRCLEPNPAERWTIGEMLSYLAMTFPTVVSLAVSPSSSYVAGKLRGAASSVEDVVHALAMEKRRQHQREPSGYESAAPPVALVGNSSSSPSAQNLTGPTAKPQGGLFAKLQWQKSGASSSSAPELTSGSTVGSRPTSAVPTAVELTSSSSPLPTSLSSQETSRQASSVSAPPPAPSPAPTATTTTASMPDLFAEFDIVASQRNSNIATSAPPPSKPQFDLDALWAGTGPTEAKAPSTTTNTAWLW